MFVWLTFDLEESFRWNETVLNVAKINRFRDQPNQTRFWSIVTAVTVCLKELSHSILSYFGHIQNYL